MDEERIKLFVVGISYSPLRSGAFALILGEEDGQYRIPIVIGKEEAQSIAINMERIVTPRPLTHDLFCSFSHAFGIELLDVYIYKFEDGIFSSELTFSDGTKIIKLDSRTSDAIAIALRMNAPIYTNKEILEQAGAIFKIEPLEVSDESAEGDDESSDYEDMTDENLQEEMKRLIENEDYEEAAKINEILKKRNNEGY